MISLGEKSGMARFLDMRVNFKLFLCCKIILLLNDTVIKCNVLIIIVIKVML